MAVGARVNIGGKKKKLLYSIALAVEASLFAKYT